MRGSRERKTGFAPLATGLPATGRGRDNGLAQLRNGETGFALVADARTEHDVLSLNPVVDSVDLLPKASCR